MYVHQAKRATTQHFDHRHARTSLHKAHSTRQTLSTWTLRVALPRPKQQQQFTLET
jgi:hypothetical protein